MFHKEQSSLHEAPCRGNSWKPILAAPILWSADHWRTWKNIPLCKILSSLSPKFNNQYPGPKAVSPAGKAKKEHHLLALLFTCLHFACFQNHAEGGRQSIKMQALTFFSNFLLTLPGSFTYTRFSRWAVVQLAGRRILTPLIKVRVLAAQPTTPRPHRLAGPGQRPFTPSTGVQIPLGTPNEFKGLT